MVIDIPARHRMEYISHPVVKSDRIELDNKIHAPSISHWKKTKAQEGAHMGLGFAPAEGTAD